MNLNEQVGFVLVGGLVLDGGFEFGEEGLHRELQVVESLAEDVDGGGCA